MHLLNISSQFLLFNESWYCANVLTSNSKSFVDVSDDSITTIKLNSIGLIKFFFAFAYVYSSVSCPFILTPIVLVDVLKYFYGNNSFTAKKDKLYLQVLLSGSLSFSKSNRDEKVIRNIHLLLCFYLWIFYSSVLVVCVYISFPGWYDFWCFWFWSHLSI